MLHELHTTTQALNPHQRSIISLSRARISIHGTFGIYRLPTHIQPSTTSNHHKHALHHQNSTYSCIASIYNTITNANIIYAASPTPTSPTSNIYNNETFSTADLFTSTGAGHSNMLSAKRYHCFILPLHHTFGVGITGLSFLRYPTSFTSKRRITFPVYGFSFPFFLSILFFFLAIVFFFEALFWTRNTSMGRLSISLFTRGGIYQRMGKKRFRIPGGF